MSERLPLIEKYPDNSPKNQRTQINIGQLTRVFSWLNIFGQLIQLFGQITQIIKLTHLTYKRISETVYVLRYFNKRLKLKNIGNLIRKSTESI